jgi:phage tail-like protein
MPTEELIGAYNFLLEVTGITQDSKIIIGGFKSLSGMDSETEIIEFKQGNDKVVRKKPGRTTYANIVLERGYTATDDLWLWRKNIEDGIIDRRSGSIIILAWIVRGQGTGNRQRWNGNLPGFIRRWALGCQLNVNQP